MNAKPLKIHLDFETYSDADLRRVGAFRYAQDPSTDVLIARYSLGEDGAVHTWIPCIELAQAHRLGLQDLTTYQGGALGFGRRVPKPIRRAISAGATFHAHNAQFEWCIWEFVVCRFAPDAPHLPPSSLVCSAAQASYAGLSRSLGKAADALQLAQRKDTDGDRLIKILCSPRKPTKADPSVRIHPLDDPVNFLRFVDYCGDDVRTERELATHLPEMPEFERRIFAVNMLANIRGVPVDIGLLEKARSIVGTLERRNRRKVKELTQGIRPTQRDKLIAHIEEEYGIELADLKATTLRDLLKQEGISPRLRDLLLYRLEASRVSTRKLDAMLRVASNGDRLRGTTLYYGAHTGRDSSKLVQVHNFIRGSLSVSEQEQVFKLLEKRDPDLLELVFRWPLETISQCMRGFLRPLEGYKFLIADYSAIEAKVLAWLADDDEILDAYRKGTDTYLMMAEAVYKIPLDDLIRRYAAKDPEAVEMRRIAKQIVLGCGFGMGWKKFILYCANQGIHVAEDFAQRAVKIYRKARHLIEDLWYAAERAAIAAVENRGKRFKVGHHITYYVEGVYLCAELPSGRCIRYPFPKVEIGERFGKPAKKLSYRTHYKGGKWMRISTYGGKLVENFTQGTARDFLYAGVLSAESQGFQIINCVHDEAWSERRADRATKFDLDQYIKAICTLPSWAIGCPVTAEGFVTDWYRKG